MMHSVYTHLSPPTQGPPPLTPDFSPFMLPPHPSPSWRKTWIHNLDHVDFPHFPNGHRAPRITPVLSPRIVSPSLFPPTDYTFVLGSNEGYKYSSGHSSSRCCCLKSLFIFFSSGCAPIQTVPCANNGRRLPIGHLCPLLWCGRSRMVRRHLSQRWCRSLGRATSGWHT